MRILVVESDVAIGEYLVDGLSEFGHIVDHIGEDIQELMVGLDQPYDAFVVNRMLPSLHDRLIERYCS